MLCDARCWVCLYPCVCTFVVTDERLSGSGAVLTGGFGPVAPGGVGVAYFIYDNRIHVFISSQLAPEVRVLHFPIVYAVEVTPRTSLPRCVLSFLSCLALSFLLFLVSCQRPGAEVFAGHLESALRAMATVLTAPVSASGPPATPVPATPALA
jgi:hypothetical protein